MPSYALLESTQARFCHRATEDDPVTETKGRQSGVVRRATIICQAFVRFVAGLMAGDYLSADLSRPRKLLRPELRRALRPAEMSPKSRDVAIQRHSSSCSCSRSNKDKNNESNRNSNIASRKTTRETCSEFARVRSRRARRA